MSSADDVEGETRYEPDTDEVLSNDDATLYKYRPNRWKGERKVWEGLTEGERFDARALDKLKSQDLSAHLYNAFAMRSRANMPLPDMRLTRSVRPAACRMLRGRATSWLTGETASEEGPGGCAGRQRRRMGSAAAVDGLADERAPAAARRLHAGAE